MSVTSILICLFCMIARGRSIPPSQCFEPFNYEDCGRRPLHVLYFYKPGARCEVAIWRGCPTRNMFKDEYECINTCIFVERAKAEDYHNFGMDDDYQMPLNYGEANDTIEDQEGTTVAGDKQTGTDGKGAAESGGSDKGAGAVADGSNSDGKGSPADAGANEDGGSAKESAPDAAPDGAPAATTDAAPDAAPEAAGEDATPAEAPPEEA